MDLQVEECAAHCPFCGESISLLLDPSAGGQSYIEDCQVCCRPMQINYDVDGDVCASLTVTCAQ